MLRKLNVGKLASLCDVMGLRPGLELLEAFNITPDRKG